MKHRERGSEEGGREEGSERSKGGRNEGRGREGGRGKEYLRVIGTQDEPATE